MTDAMLKAVFESLDIDHNEMLKTVPTGEPLFILRAHDMLAVKVIDYWIESYRATSRAARGMNHQDVQKKILKAEWARDAIRQWQIENGAKLPD